MNTTNICSAVVLSCLICACDGEPGSGSGSGTNGTTASISSTTGGGGAGDGADDGGSGGQADTTSVPANECEDDYHGNNSPFDMMDLQLDTKETTTIVLGDGDPQTPAEVGLDELVVCGGEPDFFNFELACDSYVSVEVRKLEGPEAPPDLFLYDTSSFDADPSDPPPIDSSKGDYKGFFLRPIQQKLFAGPQVIEVRPSLMDERAYTLTVTVLPTQENCAQ